MFRFLQNLLNLSEIKLSPASHIIFFGKTYSEKIILHAIIKLYTDRSSLFYDWEPTVIVCNTKVVKFIV